MAKKKGKLLVGTSGYSYTHWKERFYPPGLPQGKWLEFYAKQFSTVELNVCFYRLPSVQMFTSWRTRTPARFRFAVKGWGRITHRKVLKDCEEYLHLFYERASELGPKLSIILWQLPPYFKQNLERLDQFLGLAAKIIPVRQTVEFRSDTWLNEETYTILKKYNVALCLSDMPKVAVDDVITADFIYIRRHGPRGNYQSEYPAARMKELAARLAARSGDGKDCYVFFNNDDQAKAVTNARQVIEALKP